MTPAATPPLPLPAPVPLGGGPDLARLRRLAEYLIREPGRVFRCIRTTLADPKRMDEVARQSYRHVNGFAKIRILENDRYSARMHVWPKGEDRQGDVDPHGHRWEFASWVAAGDGVAEQIYVEAAEDDPAAHPYLRFDYRRPFAGSGRLEPTGRQAWLKERSNRVLGPKMINDCALDVVHTVAPIGTGLVATVLLQGRDRVEATKVFRLDESERSTAEQPLDVAELEQVFVDVLRAMGQKI